MVNTSGRYPIDFSIIDLECYCEDGLSKWQFCGANYELEVKTGDSWKTVPKNDDATERIQYISDKKVLIRVDRSDFDYEFTEGEYRFIQNVTEDANETEQTDDLQIVFEFELSDMDKEETVVSHKIE